jgi:hypothetical protein
MIFGAKRVKVSGDWRSLHNEEIYVLYSSRNIIWVMTSRSMKWTGHVSCIRDRFIKGFGGET